MTKSALVFFSDTHCGSTIGLMHPDGVMHDDGQMIMPSKLQEYLWSNWVSFRADISQLTKGYRTHVFAVGDLTDADHHRSTQLLSNDEGIHIQVAADCIQFLLDGFKYESLHAVRGTPAHVGKAAGLEKAVMGRLNREGVKNIVKDPTTNSFVWPFVYAEIDGVLFDIRHHGRAGQREHTRASYSRLYALDMYLSHHLEGRKPADVAVRAHLHKYMDSGYDHRGITRAIQLPCWKLHDEFTRRISIESMPDCGGLVILLHDGVPQVHPLLYKPEADPQRIWKP